MLIRFTTFVVWDYLGYRIGRIEGEIDLKEIYQALDLKKGDLIIVGECSKCPKDSDNVHIFQKR